MSCKIKTIRAREILDSRGNPTIETTVILNNGIKAKASVPSGASTGIHEACELRDMNNRRYNGKGVLTAVMNVNSGIFNLLKGIKVTKQVLIDKKMIKLDGTKNKENLGANAILSVSLACARAGAIYKKQELYEYIRSVYKIKFKEYKLPQPSFNILNGGRHANNGLNIQEFMIMPIRNISDKPFADKVRIASEIFHKLKNILIEKNLATGAGDEGGYAPKLDSNTQAFNLITEAIEKTGYKPGVDVVLGIDAGASEFYDKKNKKYILKLDNLELNSEKIIELYDKWIKKYPIFLIEDGLDQDDWKNWSKMTEKLSDKIKIVGDDLFTTNIDRLKIGIKEKAGNTILIKLNQIGSLSETIECANYAQKNNYKLMISHRSGETCDSFIADLAVSINAEYIKSGSLSRGERLAKYNRLMEIESHINKIK